MEIKDPTRQTEPDGKILDRNTARVAVDGQEYEITAPGKYDWYQLPSAHLSYTPGPGGGHEDYMSPINLSRDTHPPEAHLRVSTNSMGWRTIGIAVDSKFAETGGRVQALVAKKGGDGNIVRGPDGKVQLTWQSVDRTDGVVRFQDVYMPGFGAETIAGVTLDVNFRIVRPNDPEPSYYRAQAIFGGSRAPYESDSYVQRYIAPLKVKGPPVE